MISLNNYILTVFLISVLIYTIIVPIRIYTNNVPTNAFSDNTIVNIKLWIIRVFHLTFVLFLALYIFFFTGKKYDILHVILTLVMILHWKFLGGECILDYYEKHLLNNKYIIGESLHEHIYVDLVYSKLLFVSTILLMITFIIIAYRSNLYMFLKIILIFVITYIYIRNLINRPIEYFL